jgi:hypothetical protein
MRTFFFILFIVILSGCLQKKRDAECNRFQAGRFLITVKTSHTKYIINRIDSIQTELNMDTDTITMMKIKWTSPCEYQLLREYKRINTIDSNTKHVIGRYINEVPLKVRIVAVNKDYYVFESKQDGIDFIYKDTMWVIK